MKSKQARSSSIPVTLTPLAFWHLQWMLHRTPCEVSSMGLLEPCNGGLRIQDFVLVRQSVTPASVELDMGWWADKQLELFEQGIEPWQTSCWTHTHPAGVNGPSSIDEATMRSSFGGWDFVLMLILTKAGVWYGRLELDHRLADRFIRLQVSVEIGVDWNRPGKAVVDNALLDHWESEFAALVEETDMSWLTKQEKRSNRRDRKRNPPFEIMETGDFDDAAFDADELQWTEQQWWPEPFEDDIESFFEYIE